MSQFPPKTEHSVEALTQPRLLVKNSLLNMVSMALPMLAALVTIPIIIHKMGTDRFGLLTISWMFIGYFSLFDLGFGRALVNLIAARLGTDKEDTIGQVVWTALIMMSLIGIAAMFLLLIVARPLVFQVLNVPKVLQKETIEAIHILAFAIPFVLLSTGFRGVLEAFQKFKEIAVIQSIIGTSTYVGIAFILDYSVKLPASVSFLMLLKIISMLAFGWLSTRKSRLFKSSLKIYQNELKTLFSFGGWVTVSNVINPIIYQLDRFMIGVVATMTSVTFYTTPFDLIQKINVIPNAIVGVLFPAFSTSFFKKKARADKLFTSGIQIVEIIILPITVFIFMFSREIMGIWLGEKFVVHSSLVLQIFAATIIFNNLARIPFSYLYGMARPDIAAKIHLFELPFIAVLLWPVISHFGIIGAAILSGIRIVIDFFILLFFVRRLTGIHLAFFKWFGIPIIVFLVSLTVVLVVNLLMMKMLCYFILMIIFYVYTWHYLISSEQRIKLKRQAQKIFQTI